MDMQPIEEPPQSKGYIIAVVICIVIGVLYYWLSPYFYMLMEYIDTIRSLIDLMLSFTANVGESVVDETAEGSKAVVKAVSRPPKEKNLRPQMRVQVQCKVQRHLHLLVDNIVMLENGKEYVVVPKLENHLVKVKLILPKNYV